MLTDPKVHHEDFGEPEAEAEHLQWDLRAIQRADAAPTGG